MIRSALQPSTRRIGALAAPLLALAALGLAAPAHADGALGVSMSCEGVGNSAWLCDATASGGSGAYSYSWTPLVNANVTSGGATESAFGRCRSNNVATVQVTVTDTSTGATASQQDRFYCYVIAP
ncbi:hypothetical protein [Kitasatospora aureofaciens]|uniref:hypothetical protein n=1 Tax=Kitasatospora aureofaciens TaxID=1894 RepID=UPI001C458D23|nr:hypothetical protein [Kitasatospora aureofaciens]MBV6703047.1 hypothetical protein [Kitasatospora aureofaciens]